MKILSRNAHSFLGYSNTVVKYTKKNVVIVGIYKIIVRFLSVCNLLQILRILKGKGDVYDMATRRRAHVSASLSVNGVNGLINEETSIDLFQENEELKVSQVDQLDVGVWYPEVSSSYCPEDTIDLEQENEDLKVCRWSHSHSYAVNVSFQSQCKHRF